MLLREITEQLGGQFANEADVMPIHFGDVDLEVRAARSSAVVADRSARGKLLFKGADRESFLHGMLTNSVNGLQDGSGNHTALTDAKGNVQADGWLYHCGDVLVMETEPGLQVKVKEFLEKFVIADDVEILDWTASCAIIGIQGPQAGDILEKVLAKELELDPLAHEEVSIGDTDVRLVNRIYTGSPGFDLWVSEDAGTVFQCLIDAGAVPVGSEALETLRIEAGLPAYGVDVDERVVPLEARMDDTVDFAKGCFIGHEVLAKMRNLGQPRRYLVGVELDGDNVPAPETELTSDGKVVGVTKSGVRSATLGKTICLASVRRGYEAIGGTLVSADGVSCKVVELPFA